MPTAFDSLHSLDLLISRVPLFALSRVPLFATFDVDAYHARGNKMVRDVTLLNNMRMHNITSPVAIYSSVVIMM